MNEVSAFPTPYDILGPPLVPYSPSIIVWSSLILLICICGVLLWLAYRSRSKILWSIPAAFELTRQTLQAYLNQAQPYTKDQLSVAGLLVKRYLSLREQIDFTAFSPQELMDYSSKNPAQILASFCSSLAELDLATFEPTFSQLISKRIFKDLLETLERYERLRSAPEESISQRNSVL